MPRLQRHAYVPRRAVSTRHVAPSRGVPIYGELMPDDRTVLLMAIGDSEGEAMAIAGRKLSLMTPLVTKREGAVSVPATWPAIVQLGALFGSDWRPGPRLTSWVARQVVARMPAGEPDLTYLTHQLIADRTPYPWQLAGARMIADVGSVLITDEPGTGKTATAILGLVERGAFPAVVICPASVVDAWLSECQAWAPHLNVVAWRGPKRWRFKGAADVYVVSYDTARVDMSTKARAELMKLAPVAVVVDECHKIKNPQTAQSKAVRKLCKDVPCVIALSGTPITHNPGDLWPTLHAMTADAWPSRERWVQRYCLTAQGDYGAQIFGLDPGTEPEFRQTLLGQHRRVAKADVLADLPPKVYSVRTVELPPAWRKAYDAMEAEMLAALPDGEELSVMSVLAQLTRLSQLASAAADVRTETEWGEDGEPVERVHVTLKAPSWKVDALLEILDERGGPGSGGAPVVAFAPSRQLMMLAGEAAKATGYSVGYVVGGQNAHDRSAAIDAFQAGRCELLCVTTAAGGVGITLTAADTAVFLQRPWSLVDATQAEDRLHRIGSQRHESIQVIDIVAKSTIDTRVRAALRDKAGQLAELVQDPRLVAELLGGNSVTRTG